MTEQGIVSFIRLKLEHSTSPEHIRQMLQRAGFSDTDIEDGFNEVRKQHKNIHQDLVAQNDFLPPLVATDVSKQVNRSIQVNNLNSSSKSIPARGKYSSKGEHEGLFAGRLRRKDFILGFLFFFGVGYLSLVVGAVAISVLSPNLWDAITTAIESDQDGLFITTIPFILAPVTLMMMSMITRRLHNLELPGNLSWLFLVFFLPTSFVVADPLILALYIATAILFVLMITKKGHPEPNIHGAHPESKGSFFRRIFNL